MPVNKRIKSAIFIFAVGLSVVFAFAAMWWYSDAPISEVLTKNFLGGRTAVKHSNRLQHEKSPYLLQHKDNPVHWFAWGEDAFAAARQENKPIFLSIGYSTCHWCHVMEKDSFETEEVAAVLNENFINIKVDREERPDVDSIYMDAVVALTGHGGWPLSVFLTPELQPFFGGTFFWRPQFLQILDNIKNIWATDKEKVLTSGAQLSELLRTSRTAVSGTIGDEQVLRQAYSYYTKAFDDIHGGFGGAPKFPTSTNLSLLMRVYKRTQDPQALAMVELTLDRMSRGGMYDHLGGGFARYSTDAQWLVPHFEKMLYDNALLATTYLEAFQITGKEFYAQIAREIFAYVMTHMTAKDGAFYSAEDADSEGEEGKFYVWHYDEVKELLSADEFKRFVEVYGVSPQGNFEHGANILNLVDDYDWSARDDALVKSAMQKLLTARQQRIHPHKDDKVLTAWNGLMIAAFAKGYQVLGDRCYLAAAQAAARFIKKQLYADGELRRRFRDGDSRFRGYHNDYAFLVHGLLNLYEADFDTQWLIWALELQAQQDQLFWDNEQGGYYFTATGTKNLITRQKEFYDGAIPSGNSFAILNLLRLYALTFDKDLFVKAEKLLALFAPKFAEHPASYSQALAAFDFYLDSAKEIAVVVDASGNLEEPLRDILFGQFLPNKVVAFKHVNDAKTLKQPPLLEGRALVNDKTTVYVCEQGVCKLPTNDLRKAKDLINAVRSYDL